MKGIVVVMWALAASAATSQVAGLDLGGDRSHPLGLADAADFGAFVDLDGDGRLDLLGRDAAFVAGPGGVFTAVVSIAPLASPGTHAIGDLDGDGDVDVFNSDVVALNDGTGRFVPRVGALPLLPPPTCGGGNVFTHPVVADFDGDGDADVFAPEVFGCGVLGGVAHLLLNDGTASFTVLPAAIPGTAIVPTFSFAGDIDGDGDADVLLATPTNLFFFLNDGAASFTVGPAIGTGAGAERAVVGDFDGDGSDDFAFHRAGVFEIVLRSTGGFLPPVLSPAPNGVSGLTAIDLDLDGADELVIVDRDGLAVLPVLASGAVARPSVRLYYSNKIAAEVPVLAGDLDDDGDDDLLVSAESRTMTFLGDGSGSLEELPRHDTVAAIGIPGAVGDFDRDGDVDLAVREPVAGGGHRIGIFANDGRGRFAVDPTSWSMVSGGVGDIAHVFDHNGDGFPDLYLAAGTGNPAPDLVLTNIGAGWIVTATLAGSGKTVRVADGDLDGDGDADIVLARDALSNHLVVENLGGGTFAPPRSLAAAPGCATDLELGDVDGDGDLDVLVACVVLPARLYLNDGAANFSLGHVFGTFLARASALVDLDGDGDLDAIVNRDVWLNDGAASFTFQGHIAPSGIPSPHRTIDVDEDGNPDLFGIEGDVWLNQGNYTFVRHALSVWPHRNDAVPHVVLDDVDRDGDVDALIDGRLHLNFARHLASRGPRKLGEPQSLDVHASGPGVIFWLYASLVTVDLPLPPFGTLFLDPAASLLFAAGAVSPGGRAEVAVPVPNNPAIVGVEILWQALTTDGFDTHLTNLHSMVLRP